MKLLDLFCGAGGAAMGYYRAGFTEIVGVDINPQPRYPFTFVQADAFAYLERPVIQKAATGWFDAIHASPPCQGYSVTAAFTGGEYPLLIEGTRRRLKDSGLPWVIENVMPAPVRKDVMLCGTMFGLPTFRHRRFESSVALLAPKHVRHRPEWTTVAHRGYSAFKRGATHISVTGFNYPPEDGQRALGIDWTRDREELSEAIPPAYTEYIGRQLLAHITGAGSRS